MFEGLSEEERRELIKEFEQATSHLEAPFPARITGVIMCKSCIHRVFREMRMDDCDILGEVPRDYLFAKEYICPHYERNPDSPEYDVMQVKKQ